MIQRCDDKLLTFNLLLLVSVVACEMKEIWTFTAHERGKVEIRCPYEPDYKDDNKYLCRGKCLRLFKDKPVESGSAAQDERFSLTDNKTALIFTVTITDLRTEDQGKYWCGIETGRGKLDDFTQIHLEIIHVSRVSGVTGKLLNILCHYKRNLKNNVKFICKGSDPSLCEKSAIKVSSETNSNGRFSLSDNTSARVFTVTIADLTENDSGIYWCGAVHRGQGHKIKWISVTDLNISAVTSESMTPKPTTKASLHVSKPPQAQTASNRPITSSLSSSPSASSTVLLLFSSSNAVSQKPQSVVIMVMVIGILTGFGFLLFIYLRWKQKKEETPPKDVVHGPTNNLPTRDTGETREATHTVYDYEDIRNIPDQPDYSVVLPAFAERDASVYALAQIPSISSVDLTYSSIKFSAGHHSNKTSDGQETCDYASVKPKDCRH
ncbi:uncharacterized protein [Garra rufa]|uniref:uncharacterized protein isoform X2 n=1 Tax=Garra rufa TaxID=137080 RepID=UPI003CCE719D